MIAYSFNVKNIGRLIELQDFIEVNMPTARFEGNPFELISGEYQVTISYNVSDQNKLHPLFNKWYDIDNFEEEEKSNDNWFKNFLNKIKF